MSGREDVNMHKDTGRKLFLGGSSAKEKRAIFLRKDFALTVVIQK